MMNLRADLYPLMLSIERESVINLLIDLIIY